MYPETNDVSRLRDLLAEMSTPTPAAEPWDECRFCGAKGAEHIGEKLCTGFPQAAGRLRVLLESERKRAADLQRRLECAEVELDIERGDRCRICGQRFFDDERCGCSL